MQTQRFPTSSIAMSRTPRPKPLPRGRAPRLAWLLLLPTALLWGCGGGPASSAKATIGKDKFISTYVALRQAALNRDSVARDSARAAVLRRAGVTPQEMLAFADVHGRDVKFMAGVWTEVQQRLEETRPDSLREHRGR